MEKKLKSVRGNLLAVIVLMIVLNGYRIISPLGEINILFILLDRVLPIIYIAGFIFSLIKYKSNIDLASKIQIILTTIMIILTTITIMSSQKFTILSIVSYLIPVVLMYDAVTIRKFIGTNIQQ